MTPPLSLAHFAFARSGKRFSVYIAGSKAYEGLVSKMVSPALDANALTRRVREALCLPTFQLDDWHCTPLTGHISNPATGGLYRVSGSGRQDTLHRHWSLVLKIAHLTEDAPQGWGTDLLHFGYWKREALAYQSGMLEDLSANLRVPHCFEVVEQPDGSVYLWLEEITESGQADWTVPRYGLAARHFGQWQGTYLAGRALPASPWLHPGWLRSWVSHFAFLENYVRRSDLWEHPLLRAAFPTSVTDRLLDLWAERMRWLDILDGMPLTLCHFDTWRPNLLSCVGENGQEQTVALDWQGAGLGPVGEIGNLLLTSLMSLEVKAADAQVLDTVIWENYLQGLMEAGWKGNPRQVRFCYTAYPALRWGLVFPLMMILPYVHDASKRAEAEAKYGRSIEELLRQWADVLYFLLDRADEARCLASAL